MITTYIQQLVDYTKYLEQRIIDLERSQANLRREMEEFKNQSQQNKIDRVEYKFDQLKIERLEGTLNIGLSPFHDENQTIEDFSVNQEQLDVHHDNSGFEQCAQNVKRHIHQFMMTECENIILSLEQTYQYQLDPTYRQFIVYDVQKQIDQRIDHYLKTFDRKKMNHDHSYQQKAEHEVSEKVKKDIHKTLDAFIKNLPKEMGRSL